MADLPQIIATYDALVGVALGAGLTYGFSALNRRHQESREDATRWYEVRLNSYVALTQAVSRIAIQATKEGELTHEERAESVSAVLAAIDSIRLVGSTEVVAAAEHVRHMAADWQAALVEKKAMNLDGLLDPLTEFRNAARKDLGHPSP